MKNILLSFFLIFPTISFAANIELSTTSSNLGIGTVAQSGNKLDVNGNIRATNFTGPGTGLTGIGSSSVNWTNVNGLQPINTGGINWTTVNAASVVGNGGVNWSSVNAGSAINAGGINWPSINGATSINSAGINWTNFPSAGFMVFGGSNAPTADTNTYIVTGGNAGTATALAANGANCSAGNYPLGVDASGAVEGCTAAASSGLWVTGGVGINTTSNVGIGSSNPVQMLDVVGTVKATAFQAGAGTATISGDANGNIGIGTSSSSTMVAIGSTGQIRVDSNGNLGVGTVAPPQKLYVAGTGEFQGFKMTGNGLSAGYVLTASSVGLGTWMPASGGNGTVSSGTADRVGIYDTAGTTISSSTKIFDDGTNVGIGTIAPRTAVEIGVQAINVVGSNVGLGSTNPGQVLDVNGAIRSTGAGVSVFGGNVGIGTSVGVPNALYVVGTPMFTTGLNIGIGTAAVNRLCIANGALTVCN
jgi:hypothetical protein